jgi:hypothetical protein
MLIGPFVPGHASREILLSQTFPSTPYRIALSRVWRF